jgi:hypothetical protein
MGLRSRYNLVGWGGGKLRMLSVLDEHTREFLCIHVDRRINAHNCVRLSPP